jgi:hypothetical protein
VRQRSDIPATSVSQLRAGLASCTLLPDANFMPGSPPFQRASCTDQIVTGTTAWKNAKPVCSERAAQLLAEGVSNIRPKAGPFG